MTSLGMAAIIALTQALVQGERRPVTAPSDTTAAATTLANRPSTTLTTVLAEPSLTGERRANGWNATQQVSFDATRFDSATGVALRSLLQVAAERGLPTAPLINRALEGAARRASSAKILEVVREYAGALSQAREMLGAESTTAELETGASALRAGVDGRMLVAVREVRPPGSAVVALMVLTDVVQRGVPSVTARDAVTSIARLPRSDEALLGLQVTVAKNALRGPGMAVDALRRYVRGTVPGSTLPLAPATVDRKPVRPPPP